MHGHLWSERADRKPLIISGARQVGKTFVVERWGHKRFESVVKIDLEREQELHGLFSESDPRRMLDELALLKKQPIRPGTSLLFLDEIQACPKALAMLRYFYELLPELHVVAAGSLLDFAMREFQHSMPVGRIEFLYLHPMSFEEFLEAVEGSALVEYLGQVSLQHPPSAAMDRKLSEASRRYFFVGGMPAAVRAHAGGADLLQVQRIQSGLIQTVQEDFAKYGPRQLQQLMRKTHRYAAENVGRKLKFVNVSREARSGEIRRALELLSLSRVIHLVYHTSANGLPLGGERSDRHFKPLFLDVGLVNRMCGLDLIAAEELITVNEGALAEQFVGQQLIASAPPFEDPQVFYWTREARNANAEVDFVISRHQDILPVEVKAGKTGRLRSLFQFLSDKDRRKGLRFHQRPPVLEEITLNKTSSGTAQLLSLPLYLVGQLDRLMEEAFPSKTTS